MTATAPDRGTRLRGSDVVAVLAAQGVVIAALWIAHGGPDQLGEGPAGILTAIGQVTALYGTYLALIQLVLMSRSPWLDETFGMDGLAVAHRWLGFATVWLLLGHGIATTIGYALSDRVNAVQEFVTLITTYPYVLMATVSGGLFALVAITSIKAARRKLAYETWYGLHLYAYLAVALGFLHQLFVGADFMHDQLAAIYWILLYVADGGPDPGLPHRAADPDVAPAPAPGGQRGHGGPGRGQPVPHRARARPPLGPRRPVLPLALPHARRLVALAPLLDLGGPERGLAAHHGQGPRATGPVTSRGSRSARA